MAKLPKPERDYNIAKSALKSFTNDDAKDDYAAMREIDSIMGSGYLGGRYGDIKTISALARNNPSLYKIAGTADGDLFLEKLQAKIDGNEGKLSAADIRELQPLAQAAHNAAMVELRKAKNVAEPEKAKDEPKAEKTKLDYLKDAQALLEKGDDYKAIKLLDRRILNNENDIATFSLKSNLDPKKYTFKGQAGDALKEEIAKQIEAGEVDAAALKAVAKPAHKVAVSKARLFGDNPERQLADLEKAEKLLDSKEKGDHYKAVDILERTVNKNSGYSAKVENRFLHKDAYIISADDISTLKGHIAEQKTHLQNDGVLDREALQKFTTDLRRVDQNTVNTMQGTTFGDLDKKEFANSEKKAAAVYSQVVTEEDYTQILANTTRLGKGDFDALAQVSATLKDRGIETKKLDALTAEDLQKAGVKEVVAKLADQLNHRASDGILSARDVRALDKLANAIGSQEAGRN